MSSSKDYVTIIGIDNPSVAIRSGLTAQVQIEARVPGVLMVPVQCVVEVAKKNYVITLRDGEWGYKEVKLGLSNDKQVIVEEARRGKNLSAGPAGTKVRSTSPGCPKKTLKGKAKTTSRPKANRKMAAEARCPAQ